jgi:HPt (histidine-containing phosphotransfer) domain-containing protein
MTANATDADRQRCLDAGMNDFVAKPMASASLRAALDRIEPRTAGIPDSPGAGPFDYAAAVGRTDPDVIESIGHAFVESCGEQRAGIAAAVAERDAGALLRNAHTLRGLAGYFGAEPVVELSRRLETIAEASDWAAADEAQAALHRETMALSDALSLYLAGQAD